MFFDNALARVGFMNVKTGIFSFCLAAIVLFFGTVGFAQPNADPNSVFPVEYLEVVTGNGSFEFSVEIADEPDERSKGLMFREKMLPTHGMLFDFGKTSPVMMWMQNTPLSLDMIFIKEDGKVARVASNTEPFSQTIISSGEPVSHVLELNAGIARQIGIKPGDKVIHPFFTAQD